MEQEHTSFNALEQFLFYLVRPLGIQKTDNMVSLCLLGEDCMAIFSRDSIENSTCFFDLCSLDLGKQLERVELDLDICMVYDFLKSHTAQIKEKPKNKKNTSEEHFLTLQLFKIKFSPKVIDKKLEEIMNQLINQANPRIVAQVVEYQKDKLNQAITQHIEASGEHMLHKSHPAFKI